VAEDDSYSINIDLEGRGDTSRTTYSASDSSKEIVFRKDSESLAVSDFKVSPPILSCGSKATFYYNIVNTGKNDINPELIITNADLGIDYQKAISIKEGDSASASIILSPAVVLGTHTINFEVQSGSKRVTKTLDLKISECKSNNANALDNSGSVNIETSSSPNSAMNTYTSNQEPEQVSTPVIGYAVTRANSIKFTQSSEYLFLLVIAFIILLGIVIYAIGATIIILKR
jgi:hypothetical protein